MNFENKDTPNSNQISAGDHASLSDSFNWGEIVDFEMDTFYANSAPEIEATANNNDVALVSRNNDSICLTRILRPVIHLPTESSNPYHLEEAVNVEEQCKVLYSRSNVGSDIPRDVSYFPSGENRDYNYHSLSVPSNLTGTAFNLPLRDDGSPNSTNTAPDTSNFTVPNNLQRHFFGEVASGDPKSVLFDIVPYSAAENPTGNLQMTQTNAGLFKMLYNQGYNQGYNDSSRNLFNTFSNSSMEEAGDTSMNLLSTYSFYDSSPDGTENWSSLYSSSNSPSNTFSWEENQSLPHSISEKDQPYLSSDLQSKPIGEIIAGTPSAVSFESNLLGNEEPILDKSIALLSNIYRESVRQLYSITHGNLNDIDTRYALDEIINKSTTLEQTDTQLAYCSTSSFNSHVDVLSSSHGRFCRFCFKNREPEFVFRSHKLKDNQGIVTCPVLRKYTCPICGTSGDYAHTVKYCPMKDNKRTSQFSQNSFVSVQNTPERTPMKLSPFSYFPNITEGSHFDEFNEDSFNSSAQLSSEPFQNFNEAVVQELDIDDQYLTTPEQNSYDLADYRTLGAYPSSNHERLEYAFPSANIYKRKKPEICKFCRKNNKSPDVYSSHRIRNEYGVVECPFLRTYICDVCGATGDFAHTRKYCPHNTYEDFIQRLSH